MNRTELLNDNLASLTIALDGRQAVMWTALPGIIESVNFTNMTVSVQPTIQGSILQPDGSLLSVDLPLLVDVPIVFPSAGGFIITFPIAVGNEVLVIFASRCIDAWWQSSGIQRPMEARMHDLSDGFAIPGPRSVPNVVGDISSTGLQIRNNSGTTYIELAANGKIGFENNLTSLKDILTNLESLLNTFMTVLAGFPNDSTPVTHAELRTLGIPAVSSLAIVLTEINNLLE